MEPPWSVIGAAQDVIVLEKWPFAVAPISSNVNTGGPERHPLFAYTRFPPCECSQICVGDGGSSCINFSTNTMCDDRSCPNGIGCGNHFIETYPLELFRSACGVGVVATRRIPRGAFVVEYVVELIDSREKQRRHNPDYTIQIRHPATDGRTVFIDAARCGNLSRFVNHACSPNCAFFEYRADTATRIGNFTLNEIEPLQELSVSYVPVANDSKLWFTCRCGWPNCIDNQRDRDLSSIRTPMQQTTPTVTKATAIRRLHKTRRDKATCTLLKTHRDTELQRFNQAPLIATPTTNVSTQSERTKHFRQTLLTSFFL
ncbi:hypothetical protein DVH05_019943 [Phytophthora capsici]|nr:hypothetical protein DVH05_019943 [Phytophthora capsici]